MYSYSMKSKTLTELRSTLFETCEDVIAGKTQLVTHKNGHILALMSLEKMQELYDEIELHKNLCIGYAQAMRGEGITTLELKKKLGILSKKTKTQKSE